MDYSNVVTNAAIDFCEKKGNNPYGKNEKNTSKKNIITAFEINENKENVEITNKQENKTRSFNMGDNFITLRTRDNQDKMSVIEVKLPNPYLNIDKPERNKTIEYRLKSKFKSPYADYINHSLTKDSFYLNVKLKKNKYLNSNKDNNNIHFSRTQEKVKL